MEAMKKCDPILDREGKTRLVGSCFRATEPQLLLLQEEGTHLPTHPLEDGYHQQGKNFLRRVRKP